MLLEFQQAQESGIFQLSDFTCPDQNEKMNSQSLYRIVWALEDSVMFEVDAVPLRIEKNQMAFFTPHNIVKLVIEHPKLISFSFNREFYCIHNHDQEVSCYGQLFYGSSEVPVITLCEKDQASFHRMMEIFKEEFEYKDQIQGQMLEILLKRMLIKSSRLIKEKMENPEMPQSQLDVIRQFNVLVEQNFREKHQVQEYADLLFKSPKTLSNLFKQFNDKSPLEVIKDRLTLEAKRLLKHTTKTIDEITYELGYSDAAHFSKFFKKQVGESPNNFRKGKNDNL